MKIELDIPEEEVREMVNGIPPDFFSRPGDSPVRTLALALLEAWNKLVAEGKVKP